VTTPERGPAQPGCGRYVHYVDVNELSDGEIVLSPLVMDNAVEWLAGQDDEQIRWFEFARPAELSDVQRFISETLEAWRVSNGHCYWGIRRKESAPIIGGVDLRDLGDGAFNLSYVIFPLYRYQGFASKASALALRYAHDILKARTVIIKMLPGNEYSTRLAEKLGAVYVGTEPSEAGGQYKVYRLDMKDFTNER
jgi:RimJ/RimL family protein N-acetyltransferase